MLNRAQIIGNLGQDPESRSTEGGGVVVRLSVATSERWQDKSGEWQERTEWHRVVVFGKQAETCRDYLRKGRKVFVEGNLQTRSWEDKDGVKRYSTEIRAARVIFMDKGEGGGKSGGDRPPDDWGKGRGEGDRGGGSGGGGRPPSGWGKGDDRGKGGGSQSSGGGRGGDGGGDGRGGLDDEDIPFS